MNAATFDQAFRPTDNIDHLAQLMGSVTDLDPQGRWCHMTDGGQTLAVFGHYCAHCGGAGSTIRNGDGSGPCIHKEALELAWRAEVMAREEDAADLRQTRAL